MPAFFLVFKDAQTNSGSGEMFKMSILYEFPHVWGSLGYVGSWFTYTFFGLLGILLITVEFGNKTLRQNIITGLGRAQFLTGKFVIAAVISLLLTAIYFIVGLIYGFIHTDSEKLSEAFQFGVAAEYFARYWLQSFGHMAIGIFLGVLFRKSGIAIIFYLLYFFLEMILRHVVHSNLLFNSKTEWVRETMHFYPLNCLEDLLPLTGFTDPLQRSMFGEGNQAPGMDFDMFLSTTQAVAGSSIYLAIFMALSYFLMIKRDL